MNLDTRAKIVKYTTTILLLFFCFQHEWLNLNLFSFLGYMGMLSFLNYRSSSKMNVIHISWMSACVGAGLYFSDFGAQGLWFGLVPLSLIMQLSTNSKMKSFVWIQGFSITLFAASGILYAYGEAFLAAIFAVVAILARQSHFPFHLWIVQAGHKKDLYPSFLFFILAQSGFVFFAQSYLSSFELGVVGTILPAVTMFSGLYLAVRGLLEKDLFSRHLFILVSQGSLAMASYESFSNLSATGGVMFALTLVVGGGIFCLVSYQIYLQKGIERLDKFHSLYRSNKQLAAIYLVSGLSITGLPLTLGYVAEDILFHGLINTASGAAGLYIFMSAINAFSIFQAFNFLFFGHSPVKIQPLRLKLSNKLGIGSALIFLVASGVFAGPLSKFVEKSILRNRKASAQILNIKDRKAASVNQKYSD